MATRRNKRRKSEKADSQRLPTVVGIGASAGGLAALKSFFEHVPQQSGVAYVVVVHLSPQHESHLAELLQPHARLPVRQVTENVPLEADQIYVIAPDSHLSTIDSHLRISRPEKPSGPRAPIDHFFRTLASAHDGRSVGVILSGTGSDGALGIKAIKERDGLTVVQDPVEAEYDGMPQSAIATGAVDLVLPLAEIADAILKFERTRPRVSVPDDDESIAAEQGQLLQKIFAHLRARTGRDFTRYKPSTILRRIQRRMQLRQVEELSRYLELLREDADEVRDLADDLLINVTNFFRDPDAWQHIADHVIPKIFAARQEDDRIRVWSVGCATGEEVYTLAMLLAEEAARREDAPQVQIFASDLHDRSLKQAREGFYPGDIDTDVSAERLKRFFHKEEGGYRVRKELREQVVFAPHNLLADPPFSRLDLIACRNVLIYLQRDVQQEVLELFHYALRPDGFLMLGASETVDRSEFFHTESKRHSTYRKRNIRATEPRLPVFPTARLRARIGDRVAETPEPIAYATLHQHMLVQYSAPSMLLAPDGRIVHLSHDAGRYLVHPAGELTASVFKLLREELRIELRAALHTAREQRRTARSAPVSVRLNGTTAVVVLDVRLAQEPVHEGFALVVFEEQTAAAAAAAAENSPSTDGQRIAELEAELDQARQRMQAVIEEYETSQEEMKASHEELQSANEELRSTLEELETSKEELQSMNEELQTVNQENRHKVEELAQLSADLQNLLTSTEIATLFLDRELRILRFTPQVSELFNIRLVDKGRPLSDLTNRLGYGELREDAEAVLRRLIPIEREVQDHAGRWYLTRVLPYRDTQDRIEGVVVTFMEISARVRAEAALRELNETLEQRVALRTAELERTNEMLAREVRERERVETARREVLRQLVTAEEELRRTISLELHDSMGQLVTGLQLGLKAVDRTGRSAADAARLEALERLALRLGTELQHMAMRLRPPGLDNLGLLPAIRAHVDEWAERHHTTVDFHSHGLEDVRLPAELETAVYRIVQETLNNVLKHAQATHVSVMLERRAGLLSIIIEDNGRGFAVEETLASPDKAGNLGLRGMRERVELLGGELDIESSPGSGTTVFVRILEDVALQPGAPPAG